MVVVGGVARFPESLRDPIKTEVDASLNRRTDEMRRLRFNGRDVKDAAAAAFSLTVVRERE